MPECIQCNISTPNPKFCSRSCSATNQNHKRKPRSKRMYRCKACGENYHAVHASRQYCSRKCSYGHGHGGSITIPCEFCGVIIKYPKSQQRRFCTQQCHIQFKASTYIAAWLQGDKSGNKGQGDQLSSYVRDWVLLQAGYKCTSCHWGKLNTYTNKIPLHVHHIDGDWSRSTPDNLEVLCPNCHSLTSNYGARNTNGRPR